MAILFGILFAVLIAFFGLNLWGVHLRKQGQRPIDAKAMAADGQRLVRTADGRQVAYCTYGIQAADAPVVVNMHGSGIEAGFERMTYEAICTELGCRGIAISQPGCGFSDEQPGRVVKDWAEEDLAAVLDAEQVDCFYITGHSQGTPHAMAAAFAFPERCLGMGLNAPLLPSALVASLQLGKTIGTGTTPSSTLMKHFFMGWYFAVFHIVIAILPPRIISYTVQRGFPKLQADTALQQRFYCSIRRAAVRSSTGLAWESAQDVCFDWGFDIRAIRNDNVCVWHSDDDNVIPSHQGKWLAEYFNANYRHATEGYGHMTYCTGIYQVPEHSMVAALLKGTKQA